MWPRRGRRGQRDVLAGEIEELALELGAAQIDLLALAGKVEALQGQRAASLGLHERRGAIKRELWLRQSSLALVTLRSTVAATPLVCRVVAFAWLESQFVFSALTSARWTLLSSLPTMTVPAPLIFSRRQDFM